ncbi:MAG: anti-sigma factor antagonist [Acidobacteria bacterium]|nr:MAG: anti-sigma factor antagonist [Acidobacteriota bacterium]
MEFKLSTRRSDSVFIVDLAGKITAGDALSALRQTIRDEVAKGHTKILLNLKDVSYIDSSGLGELIMALGTVTQTICAKCGATVFKDDEGNWDPCPQCESRDRKPWGELKLSNPGRQVMDLLQFTKLYTVFDVHQSEEEALTSFRSR